MAKMPLIIACLCLLAVPQPGSGTDWKPAESLTVEGRALVDPAHPFVRLPAKLRGLVRQQLWDFSRHSSGISVRFITAANQLDVRWKLASNELQMAHMPSTAVSGLDLYVRDDKGGWRYLHNFRPESSDSTGSAGLNNTDSEVREYILYLPLYNGVEVLELAAPTELKPAASDPIRKAIVVYGTSIAQGACASRPGMAWPSIVGRELDREVLNLSFAGNGRLDSEIADLMAKLDPAAFVLDPLWNMNYDPPQTIVERSLKFIGKIRTAQPDTPIVMVGESHFRPEVHPTAATKAFRSVFDQLIAAGDRHLHWIDGKDLLGDDGEATVDGIHPSDLGMQRQAEIISAELRKLLR